MPQPPRPVEVEAAPILFGVDHEHPAGAITKWSRLARLPGTARSCRTTHPCRSSRAKRRAVRRSPTAPAARLWRRGGSEPQRPARQHGRQAAHHQAEPRHQQAAEDSPADADAEDDSNSPTGAGP